MGSATFERAFIGVKSPDLFLAQIVFLVLHQETDRLRGQVHVVAGIADRLSRDLAERPILDG
jgi:hypothetical protein